MVQLYQELRDAIDEELGRINQTEEFKQRLRKLIENSIDDNLTDGDVRAVVKLALGDTAEE